MKLKVGQQVPEFEYEIAPGVIQNITDLKGKLVMITFFATWCGPCRQELPHIQQDIYNKFKNDKDFRLLIFGREHKWEEVNKFQADNKYTMPFYPDPNRAIYSKFADQFIPRNFLISPEGKVLYSSIGFVEKDFDGLRQLIKEQLRKMPVK
ncbi:MAG: TlpA family protein disulfide reductase [Candidatus Saccharibacteria bacterium]